MNKLWPKGCRLLGLSASAILVAGLTFSVHAENLDPVFAGRAEFLHSCAVCHGKDGLGMGPLAALLRKMPSNLTLLAKNNGGAFPFLRVIEAIDGRREVLYHGPREMPVWGERFSRKADRTVAQARILDLTLFLQSLQVK